MQWIEPLLDTLSARPCCGYGPQGPPGSEPTALAALTLLAYGREQPARRATAWLAEFQAPSGSVGTGTHHADPTWPTSLAVLAWSAVNRAAHSGEHAAAYAAPLRRAVDWILSLRGEIIRETKYLGHDTMLVGWPWVRGTHSWVEPTALHLLALKTADLSDHQRARQAAQLLLDRQLPQGGCNCGNTIVLGQTLRPHVQPTGLSMLALIQEQDDSGRVQRSLDYLRRTVSSRTTSASLGWALAGLTAHEQLPDAYLDWLTTAYERTRRRDNSPYKLALLALAALGAQSPFIRLPKGLPLL